MYGHHPIYTSGRRHSVIGQCLKEDYQLEEALIAGGAHAYFSGHEHVFQHHSVGGVDHFVCGASGAESVGFYGGFKQCGLDWVCRSGSAGFVRVEVSHDLMTTQFIANESRGGRVIEEVRRRHG